MARQASLFAPPPPRERAPLAPPHATADDMARRRSVSFHLFPGAAMRGWTHRPSDTPVEALRSYLPLIGQPPERLEPRIAADPSQVELRLVGPPPRGLCPHHLLAVIEGLTLDEARKALARLSEGAA
jgi:hypothetical protein